MTNNQSYIEIEFTGTTLTQNRSNTLIGTDIVIDYGDGNIVNYNGDYSHTYSTSGTYTIRIYGVTSLGNFCFYGCSGLTSVIIPDSVTSLGHSCFYNCTSLTSVVIPDSITSLGYSCFTYCYSLTNVVIPDSVTSFGHYCFYNCTNLTNVVIPNNVTSLGNFCFDGCSSLTSMVIPNNVTSLGNNCFEGCSGLADIQFNWTSLTDIPTYDSSWIRNTSLLFIIPHDTTSLYEEKGYPTIILKEASPHLFTDVKRLFLNNKEVKSIVIDEPDGGIIYEKTTTLITTNLTIEVPALVYSDVFDITGLLTDNNNNPISGASVKLYRDGSILEATETTDSNGEVTFHRSAPTSITTYTFQLIFDGDNSYSNSSSSIVTRNVNAETTILNLTSPLNNATYNEGETILISGTITTNDGETLTTDIIFIKVYDENNNELQQLIVTRGQNGAFRGYITAPSSAGNHSITVKFEGRTLTTLPPTPPDEEEPPSVPSTPGEKPQVPSAPDEEPQSVPSTSNEEPQLIYAPSEATRSYTVTSDLLTLTSNKNILSQADNDVATLTATLTNNNVGIGGETVIFTKGDTVLDTDVTDGNGEATYEYTSQGVGDVTITATCKSKQATCNISDYPAIYIDNCNGTQKEIFTTTAEGGTYKTFSYTTYQGYQCLNHNTNFGWYPPSNSGNMLIEFDMYPRGSWGGTSIKGANGTRLVWYMQGSQYNDMSYQIAVLVPSQWNKCKILIQDGIVTAWLNNNQIGQTTTTITHPFYDEMGSGTNPCYIKNLKIIELP